MQRTPLHISGNFALPLFSTAYPQLVDDLRVALAALDSPEARQSFAEFLTLVADVLVSDPAPPLVRETIAAPPETKKPRPSHVKNIERKGVAPHISDAPESLVSAEPLAVPDDEPSPATSRSIAAPCDEPEHALPLADTAVSEFSFPEHHEDAVVRQPLEIVPKASTPPPKPKKEPLMPILPRVPKIAKRDMGGCGNCSKTVKQGTEYLDLTIKVLCENCMKQAA